MKPLPAQHAKLVEQAIRAAQAAGDLPDFDIPTIEIRPSKRDARGDYSAAVAMQLAKIARMKPLDIANAIAQHLPEADFLQAVEVTPPGFLNFRLDEDWLRQQVETIIFPVTTEAGRSEDEPWVTQISLHRTPRGWQLQSRTADELSAAGWVQSPIVIRRAISSVQMTAEPISET